MGAWGAGLYANDAALDVKAMVAAVARLPLAPPDLIDTLTAEWSGADDPADEDHTVFWLVVADQLWKRGLAAEAPFAKAIGFIESGADLDRHRALGMDESDLRRRAAALAELAARLRHPPPAKASRTLKKPQPFVMSPGEVIVFPTAGGRARNPYFKPGTEPHRGEEDGWGAVLVVAADRAFGYLAWYGLAPIVIERANVPRLEEALASPLAANVDAGTCTSLHYARMGLHVVGRIQVAPLAADIAAGLAARGRQTAINDVSIAGVLTSRPVPSPEPGWPRVADLAVKRDE
jgi:hypothetical protein